MQKIKEVIVVEGKYDKIKLSQIFDTQIIFVDGFRIYRNEKMIELIKKFAKVNGVIILTDSDAAGFRIRNYIKNKLNGFSVKHAFIPDIFGKESRKDRPSKEGKLGVEGIDDKIIIDSLKKAGATFTDSEENVNKDKKTVLTKVDLYNLGLSGGSGSAQKRKELLLKLDLPEHMSANMLLDVLNTMISSQILDFNDLIKNDAF